MSNPVRLAEYPAIDAKAVTPHDTNALPDGPCRGLYIGGAGAVVVLTKGGTTVTFSAVPVGTVLPIQALRVNATSTTATNIVALY